MTRTQIEITIGIILILVTSSLLLVYGFNEGQRMGTFEKAESARAIEAGAILFEQQCSRCHGTQGLGTPGLCPPLNDRYFFDKRLKDVGWSGTLEDYIVATASGGRIVSTRPDQFAGQGTPAMPAFSETFGGPLREDQIRTIAAYIMNWESTAQDASVVPTPAGPPAGTDITQTLPPGNADNGNTLANTLGCAACHVSAPVGPLWAASGDQPGIGTRAQTRIQEPGYTGSATTPEQYLFESIVLPGAHVVEGFQDGVMPKDYGDKMTLQDVADMIAHLMTLK